MDFRGIIDMLLRSIYPFESTKTILENIPSNHVWFAVLNMIQWYFQVPLDEETSNLTVIIIPWGKYKYLRAPMGLSPSSDWFNSFTAALLQGIEGMNKSMNAFLATAESLEKLEHTLDQNQTKCEELGVKISMKIFKMGSKVKFVGFLVTNDKGRVHIEANPGKLDKIRDFQRPNSKEDVASFIGLGKTQNNWSGAISVKIEKIRELNQKGVEFK